MRIRSYYRIVSLLLLLIAMIVCKTEDLIAKNVYGSTYALTPKESDGLYQTFYPDIEWKDLDNNVINAHSSGIYFENGYYYWYGEHKIPNTSESKGSTDGGMHCYRSTDLINWTNLGIVLSVDYNNPDSDIAYGCIFQRPKVVHNIKTGKYIAYFKLYIKGNGYRVCHTAVATANSPTGPFTYSHKFLAASEINGSGDFALYQDEQGDLYHFAVRKSDRLLVKAKMTDDYLYPATEYLPCPGIAVSTEGIAIFHYKGIFHLLGSGSSGWNPNPARYYTSSSLDGPWTDQGNPCVGVNNISGLGPEKTFGGQTTFALKVEGMENQFIVLMDVWEPKNPITSRYIWLPFKVKNDKLSIEWISSWDFSWFTEH